MFPFRKRSKQNLSRLTEVKAVVGVAQVRALWTRMSSLPWSNMAGKSTSFGGSCSFIAEKQPRRSPLYWSEVNMIADLARCERFQVGKDRQKPSNSLVSSGLPAKKNQKRRRALLNPANPAQKEPWFLSAPANHHHLFSSVGSVSKVWDQLLGSYRILSESTV